MGDEQLPPAAISGRRLMAMAEEAFGGPLCCLKCYPADRIERPMFLCPMCGNKRCPKATDHELACSGSNSPGQPGSWYE